MHKPVHKILNIDCNFLWQQSCSSLPTLFPWHHIEKGECDSDGLLCKVYYRSIYPSSHCASFICLVTQSMQCFTKRSTHSRLSQDTHWNSVLLNIRGDWTRRLQHQPSDSQRVCGGQTTNSHMRENSASANPKKKVTIWK